MNYQAFLAVITSAVEPQTYAEAIKDEKWRFAVTHEIDSLEDKVHGQSKPYLLERKHLVANEYLKLNSEQTARLRDTRLG